jgi:hypothetical protein
MRKIKLWFVFLVVLLVAAPLMGGVSRAEDTYTLQYITSATGINYLEFVQGISGFTLPHFSDSGEVSVGFNNVNINGVFNHNIGIDDFRNQSSVAFFNIEPGLAVLPVTFSEQMFSQGIRITVNDFNYASNQNFNSFQGSGIVVLDVMACSFCNQFTSLTFNIGKNAIPSTPLTSVLSVMPGRCQET